ncbi:ArsR/SmtB family transcription factor [Streptomyces sp. t39]|uniref:ArsR/SmtB family transcription factor n=1 Tax=Streptomyces sp. t39 TaxID=1828156 RepID=UPI0011CEBF5E|nr:winged helix-turn-helix domain-containing protein [Streptomyces sp. t39]TXS50785.1 ArsR family transcriptional regulator [Streptomyces sp. t39]
MSENPDPPQGPELTGDALLKILTALGNPHRMRIVAALLDGRDYVSRLARELAIGRPLLHMHLQRLEAAGLVRGRLELSDGGKAMKYFELTPFCYALTPEVVARAARTLTDDAGGPGGDKDKDKDTMKEKAE